MDVTINLWALIILGFGGSIGHCIGMCGGFVLSYSHALQNRQILGHTLYSLGRLSSYTLLGIIVGGLGQALTINIHIKGIFFVVLGIILLLIGVSLLGKSRFLLKVENFLKDILPVETFFQYAFSQKGMIGIFLLGLANGLLPCGLVYTALLTAAGSGSYIWGGIGMFAFGLSTLPVMLLLGFFSSKISSMRYRNTILKIIAILLIAFACLMIYKGSMFLLMDAGTSMMMKHH
ncbi:hypothetical protein CCZ01_02700 [Helicobacter monodelphidis]|uniref:sulfite exporter TauE/SafE family protein n=1 Tax=Helicobacter sp. 15-1451 TaxID=2004995 RepID=UPI000DCD47BC|nr:sulfite exporter TauE/SafE family protein [Helicobacter sp. 15-1451]RAX58344.1 hypothetical protein CCZ01_02700 [Helicobacter sp. 15-1451]